MVRPANVHGLVVVDKSAGITSHDVVSRCRKIFGQRQVGHAGTLDPDATGVLLVGLGDATRLLRYLSESRKSYRATVCFGTATDTLDAAGTVTDTVAMHVTPAEIERAAASFVGRIEQVPPMVSALKIDGKRLHELARAGVEVERAARPVTIHSLVIEATECNADPQTVTMVVECSSGTYIRTLAADLGVALDGVAHLQLLRRLSVGAFVEAESHTLDDVARLGVDAVLSPAEAVRFMAVVHPSQEQRAKISNGATFASADFLPTELIEHPGPFAVVDSNGQLIAVYERRDDPRGVKPAVVLAHVVAQ
jgi:tRNA pseudouridine55 synthase